MPPTVRLRDFRSGDESAVRVWFNDERVTSGPVGTRDSFTPDDARAWVEGAAVPGDDRKWAIALDDSDDAVGFVALYGPERERGPEIAVLVGDPSLWGQGIARAAERQACVYAFETLGAARIHAELKETNEASQRLHASLGFRRVGSRDASGPQAWTLEREHFEVSHQAELRLDAGQSAASADFFRSAPYLEAEGVTHTLAVGAALLPVLVREISGNPGRFDAISPYGYPGATLDAGAGVTDLNDVDWSATGLVSLWVRDRIGSATGLAGGAVRSRVLLHDPAEPPSVRSRLAEQIRQGLRDGWRVDHAAGTEAGERALAAFHALYTETMKRTGASPRYFFDRRYLDGVLGIEQSWLFEALSPEGEVGAGAIAAVSDDVLHYFLGGTADAALEASPFKLVVRAMMDLADELGMPLNLGGGVHPGDGLERFKRGFANSEEPWFTHEVICDPAAYEELSAGRDAAGFFPAYRA